VRTHTCGVIGTEEGRLDELEGDGGHVPGGGQVEEGEHGGEAVLPGAAVPRRLRHHVLLRWGWLLGAVGGGHPVGRHDAHLSRHRFKLHDALSFLSQQQLRSTAQGQPFTPSSSGCSRSPI